MLEGGRPLLVLPLHSLEPLLPDLKFEHEFLVHLVQSGDFTTKILIALQERLLLSFHLNKLFLP